MMAIESAMVTADVVEVSEFPEMAQQYQVYAVPKTVVNDKVQFEGARPEATFLQAIESVTSQGNSPQTDDE
jgi:predicted DsbA family dithiol-disulfide isomerase